MKNFQAPFYPPLTYHLHTREIIANIAENCIKRLVSVDKGNRNFHLSYTNINGDWHFRLFKLKWNSVNNTYF